MKAIFRAAALSLLTLLALTSQAQLTVADTTTTKKMLQTLFGGGVKISNVTATCDTNVFGGVSLGQFDASATNLGLGTGVILSTGNINTAIGNTLASAGPLGFNTQTGAGSDLSLPGDALLTATAGMSTHDACKISFSLIPDCDTIAIKYVFASDEYPEYISSIFDVFAFYVTGPNPAGGTWTNRNIALVPGTTTPVAINTINHQTNSVYYVNNNFQGSGSGTTLEYDGFTVPLYASTSVVPCSTYQVVIAVADASDGILDSAVFLEAGGISCSSPPITVDSKIVNPIFGDNVGIEGCLDGQITLKLTKSIQDTAYFTIAYSGTATPGDDYTQPSTNVMFVPGIDSVNLYMPILRDTSIEAVEYVVITYADTFGCDGTIFVSRDTLYIYDAPITSAGNNQAFCSGNTVSIGVAPDSGRSYLWLTPTAGISNLTIPNPTLTLSHNNPSIPQVYTYMLRTSTYQGVCQYNDSIEVTVFPKPQADFVADTACFGKPTAFTDVSLVDSAIFWTWHFGDLTSVSGVQDTTHTYLANQNHTVSMVITSRHGCMDTVSRVVPLYSLPIPAFTAPPVCFGSTSILQATTPGITGWQWDLVEATRTAKNVAYIFSAPDTYAVQLIVTDNHGCVDSLTQDVVVYPLPVPGFTSVPVCLEEVTPLRAILHPDNQPITNYNWSYGDGNTGLNSEADHVYATPGLKNVTVTFTDARGCVNAATDTVRVWGLPSPSFTVAPVCEGFPSLLTNTSVAGAAEAIAAYSWHLSDGTNYVLASPSHVFAGIDDHEVRLVAISNRACTDTFIANATIYPNPVANFGAEPDCPRLPIQFSDSSTVVSGLYGSTVVAWNWAFGDGQSGSGPFPTHAYNTDGTYPVTLIPVTNFGCKDTLTQDLSVFPEAAPPIIFDDSVCFGYPALLRVAFEAPSSKVRWFADDLLPAFHEGTTYETPSVIVPQTYLVQTATPQECLSEKFPIRALLHPTVEGEVLPIDPRIEYPEPTGTFSWNGNSVDNRYVWSFGTGDTSHQAAPVYRFPHPGYYEVTAEVTSPVGCVGVFSTTAEVVLAVRTIFPSAFTPNGDDKNDLLYASLEQLRSMKLTIHDRYGAVVFTTENPEFTWDGTDQDNGQPLQEGVYPYRFEGVDLEGRPISIKGTISILR